MKKRLISLMLAINILFNLSSSTKQKDEENNTNNTSIININKDNLETSIKKIAPKTKKDIIINNIQKIYIPYNYNEYQPNQKFINVYKKLAQNNKKCNHIDQDYTSVFECIKNNTLKKYPNNNIFKNEIIPEKKDKLNMENINIQIALKQAINSIFENATNDIKEDICRLKNISIINGNLTNEIKKEDGQIFGIWDNTKQTITIDYNSIKQSVSSTSKYKENDEKFQKILITNLRDIIQHELNHARQSMCRCNSRWENNNYINSYLPKISFNTESSAQAKVLIDNYYKKNLQNDNKIYNKELNYDLLLLSQVVFNENKDINGYYDAILDNDIKALWDYFNLNNNEELENFYKILYSMDTLFYRTQLSDYLTEQNKADYKDIQEEVGYSYLIETFKISIINLIKEIDKNNYEIEDSLILYLFLKSYIIDHTNTSMLKINLEKGIATTEYNKNFIEKALLIEDEFINYINYKYKISLKELKEKLNSKLLLNKLKDLNKYIENQEIPNSEIKEFNMMLQKYPIMKYMIWINEASYSSIDYLNEYLEKNKQLSRY